MQADVQQQQLYQSQVPDQLQQQQVQHHLPAHPQTEQQLQLHPAELHLIPIYGTQLHHKHLKLQRGFQLEIIPQQLQMRMVVQQL